MKIAQIVLLAFLFFHSASAFAEKISTICFVRIFEPAENRSTGRNNIYLDKIQEVPVTGKFLFENQDDRYSYLVKFENGKAFSLILRDSKEGLNAISEISGLSLPKSDSLSVGFRKDLTPKPGEKIVLTQLECMREAHYKKLNAKLYKTPHK